MNVRIPKGNFAEHNAQMIAKEQLSKSYINKKEKPKKDFKVAIYRRYGHPQIMKDDPEKKKASPQKWAGFVESTVVNFFDEHKIEKLTIEEGNGNKAKLARTKGNGIKIEYSSIALM